MIEFKCCFFFPNITQFVPNTNIPWVNRDKFAETLFVYVATKLQVYLFSRLSSRSIIPVGNDFKIYKYAALLDELVTIFVWCRWCALSWCRQTGENQFLTVAIFLYLTCHYPVVQNRCLKWSKLLLFFIF